MDKDVEEYYENYTELFATKGWKQLVDELEEEAESLDTITTVSEIDELHYRRGKLSVLTRVLNLKDILDAAFEEVKAQNASD